MSRRPAAAGGASAGREHQVAGRRRVAGTLAPHVGHARLSQHPEQRHLDPTVGSEPHPGAAVRRRQRSSGQRLGAGKRRRIGQLLMPLLEWVAIADPIRRDNSSSTTASSDDVGAPQGAEILHRVHEAPRRVTLRIAPGAGPSERAEAREQVVALKRSCSAVPETAWAARGGQASPPRQDRPARG